MSAFDELRDLPPPFPRRTSRHKKECPHAAPVPSAPRTTPPQIPAVRARHLRHRADRRPRDRARRPRRTVPSGGRPRQDRHRRAGPHGRRRGPRRRPRRGRRRPPRRRRLPPRRHRHGGAPRARPGHRRRPGPGRGPRRGERRPGPQHLLAEEHGARPGHPGHPPPTGRARPRRAGHPQLHPGDPARRDPGEERRGRRPCHRGSHHLGSGQDRRRQGAGRPEAHRRRRPRRRPRHRHRHRAPRPLGQARRRGFRRPGPPRRWIEFDAEGRPVPGSLPHDSAYHGTHVAGTVAGGDASGTRIGVAPGAELMGGLVIPGGRGSLAQVIAGMQWAIAPYAADGTPAGKPADVVSMSLGSDGYADELVEPARNIARAGAFPAFAIGNECLQGSAAPGNVFEAVSVGATDADDNVADFSCGEVVHKSNWSTPPAEWPDTYVVPDVSAPGVDVLSALPDGGYGTLDGTSMATPHVSGTVALMLQARPDLTVDEALAILTGTSRADDRYGALPNPRYGHGRIDAYAAVTEAALNSGVRGTVTDGRSGKPLAGVAVARTDTGRTVTTDAAGRFSLRLAPGSHDLALSRFGYQDTVTRERVRADRWTDVRLELARTRWATVSGTVTYGPTGTTVPGATVSVLDVPDTLTAVTNAHGRYTIRDVPAGTRRLTAVAPGISRSRPLTVTVDGRSGARRADLALPRPAATERVSLSGQGNQPNGEAWWPDVSDDGQVVAFASAASNLVPGDTNGTLDIFVTDRDRRTIARVSVASDGTEGDDFSLTPTLSADGRYVGYSSGATTLVSGDTNRETDAFVHDRTTGVTERVSVASDGTQADGLSSAPSLSADGRWAVFNSEAGNLVAGDTNGTTDVFLRDRELGTTVRVSAAPDGAAGNGPSREQTISADGRWIAFQSTADNLVSGDTDGAADVFLYDRQTGTTRLVDGPDGPHTAPKISGDGSVVVFDSDWRLYVHDLRTGKNERVDVAGDGTPADEWAYAPSLSADGTKVAFYSYAADLAPGDTNGMADVFVRDREAGTTVRVSDGPEGAGGDGASALPALSGDGRYVAFESTSANLVGDDTNRHSDVFVHDLVAGPEARFAPHGLTVTPPRVRPGAPVRVTARVRNVGEATGTYTAVLTVAGEPEQRQDVTVRPGGEATVRFTVRRAATGTWTVGIGALTGEFGVRR
ncbi:S8 family serine peptidase [Streptomyces sp. EMB24]|uniref:S8 family serine peptidase n=1 Tax=Streptomyces sp. EMB24 TaxID=2835531 RepID=UPI00227AF8CE|nr:S8 family serine peptidase [Streptomyces sp. EMB24]